MIYEGKEYKKIVEGGSLADGQAKIGDLVHVQFSYKGGRDYFAKLDNFDRHGNLVIDGFVIGNSRKCWFNQKEFSMEIYREVVTLTDSLRYSACNTPAYKLKRATKKLYEEMSELITAKNENYGDSFSKQYQKYGMVSVEMRLNDKFMRLEQLVSGEKDKVGESIEDTLKDIIGYATLALIELEGEKW